MKKHYRPAIELAGTKVTLTRVTPYYRNIDRPSVWGYLEPKEYIFYKQDDIFWIDSWNMPGDTKRVFVHFIYERDIK